MEAESLPSLSSLLHGADQWSEVLLLLPLLVALEAVLSADNAIALAAIARRLHDPARWVLQFWPLQFLAAAYLLWLCGSQLLGGGDDTAAEADPAGDDPSPSRGLAAVVLTLGLTDLAFSLDSVAAAVAVTDRLALVMAGGVIGVVALRLTAGLFIRWLEEFVRLETAGYLAVGLVGIRLLVRIGFPTLQVPEWSVLITVALLFAWGFSRRRLGDPTESGPSAGGGG
jgi:predicted tellurium resistance membrane protein TerC